MSMGKVLRPSNSRDPNITLFEVPHGSEKLGKLLSGVAVIRIIVFGGAYLLGPLVYGNDHATHIKSKGCLVGCT